MRHMYALLSLALLMAGSMGCTMTQKVASGAAVGGVTGFALGPDRGRSRCSRRRDRGAGGHGELTIRPRGGGPAKNRNARVRGAYAGGGPRTRTALRPPKANEFDMAKLTSRFLPTFGV